MLRFCRKRALSLRNTSSLLLLLTLVLSTPLPVFAQQAVNTLRSPFLTNGREVRKAFRDVIAQPRQWTVRIIATDRQVGLGTVIGTEGWIVTKASQLRGATSVEFFDQSSLPFTVVGYLQPHDLALIKVEPASPLATVEWVSGDPEMGQWLVTVGTTADPVAVGVASARRRSIPRGTHGVLGVQLTDIVNGPAATPPSIKAVTADSGAFAAGLKAGDVVLQVNEEQMDSVNKLIATIQAYRPGDIVTLRVKRAEEEMSVKVTLGYMPDDSNRMLMQNQMGGSLSLRRDEFESVYQHDAVLSPEDCGGPVVGLDGKAFGINIARAGRTETYVLPANVMIAVIEEMKAGKFPSAASLTEGERPVAPRLPRRQRP